MSQIFILISIFVFVLIGQIAWTQGFLPVPVRNLENSNSLERNYNIKDGIVYGTLPCECGRASKIFADRIVGLGKEKARINDIPWTAALVEKNGGEFSFCGASIINDRFIMTAAHCVKGRKPEELVIWLNEENILLTNETDGERLIYDIVEIIRHPDYQGVLNDIALLKLNETVKFGLAAKSMINPVCLPINSNIANSLDYSGLNGTVAGWGRTIPGGDVSIVLMKIQVPILSNELCIEKSKYKGAIRISMLCAGILESGGADACQGDSGGPLIVYGSNGATQIGIVSWGFGCGEPYSPGVYARVTYFTSWILENTKEANWCEIRQRIK